MDNSQPMDNQQIQLLQLQEVCGIKKYQYQYVKKVVDCAILKPKMLHAIKNNITTSTYTQTAYNSVK